MISQAVLRPLKLTESQLLFADDNPSNIHDVGTALPKAATVLVPRVGTGTPFVAEVAKPRGGLQLVHAEQILRWSLGQAMNGAEPLRAIEKQQGSGHGVAEDVPSGSGGGSKGGGGRSSGGVVAGSAPRCGPCSQFVPKRPSGPLAHRCFTCGEHENLHRAAPADSTAATA